MTGMSVFVATVSGSTYEIDPDTKRARRLGNTNGSAPTPDFGEDGVWREYESLFRLGSGELVYLLFIWGAFRSTRTSCIEFPEYVLPLLGLDR